MYPKISDLINDLLGTQINLPIQSYGFMVAMAFVAAGLVVYFELKRKHQQGLIPVSEKKIIVGQPASVSEILTSLLFGYFIGLKFFGIFGNYSYFADHPQDYLLSGAGSQLGGIITALFLGFLTWYDKRRKKLPKPKTEFIKIAPQQLTLNFLVVAAVFGIAGAKLFDVVEHLDELAKDPLGTIFSFSGLAFYGGLIVAAIAVVIYARRNGIAWYHIADVAAPALMLAYAVGRIGCQLSGDGCWGIPNPNPKPVLLSFLPDWMWAFNYPHNIINEGIPIADCTGAHCFVLEHPVFPTPIYETILCTLFFLVLWRMRKRLKYAGHLFSIYLILNGLERFLIEIIRVNQRYTLTGNLALTQAQIIAIGLVITGIVLHYYFKKQSIIIQSRS
jgi:prolipoprotein diacylglyceryl transferase